MKKKGYQRKSRGFDDGFTYRQVLRRDHVKLQILQTISILNASDCPDQQQTEAFVKCFARLPASKKKYLFEFQFSDDWQRIDVSFLGINFLLPRGWQYNVNARQDKDLRGLRLDISSAGNLTIQFYTYAGFESKAVKKRKELFKGYPERLNYNYYLKLYKRSRVFENKEKAWLIETKVRKRTVIVYIAGDVNSFKANEKHLNRLVWSLQESYYDSSATFRVLSAVEIRDESMARLQQQFEKADSEHYAMTNDDNDKLYFFRLQSARKEFDFESLRRLVLATEKLVQVDNTRSWRFKKEKKTDFSFSRTYRSNFAEYEISAVEMAKAGFCEQVSYRQQLRCLKKLPMADRQLMLYISVKGASLQPLPDD